MQKILGWTFVLASRCLWADAMLPGVESSEIGSLVAGYIGQLTLPGKVEHHKKIAALVAKNSKYQRALLATLVKQSQVQGLEPLKKLLPAPLAALEKALPAAPNASLFGGGLIAPPTGTWLMPIPFLEDSPLEASVATGVKSHILSPDEVLELQRNPGWLCLPDGQAVRTDAVVRMVYPRKRAERERLEKGDAESAINDWRDLLKSADAGSNSDEQLKIGLDNFCLKHPLSPQCDLAEKAITPPVAKGKAPIETGLLAMAGSENSEQRDLYQRTLLKMARPDLDAFRKRVLLDPSGEHACTVMHLSDPHRLSKGLKAVSPSHAMTPVLMRLLPELAANGDQGGLARVAPWINDSAIPSLVKRLSSASEESRTFSADILGNFGVRVVAALIAALNDLDPNVRLGAAHALGKIGEKAEPSVFTLTRLIKDPESKMRQNVAEALGKIGKKAAKAIPALTEALADADAGVKANAAEAIGAIGGNAQELVLPLTKLLADSTPLVRASAAAALGKFGNAATSAVPALVLLLKDSEKFVKLNASEALGLIGAESSVALFDGLASEDETMREILTAGIVKLGRKAVPLLIKEVSNASAAVRASAIGALGKIGDQAAAESTSIVAEAMTDDSGLVRATAADTLGAFGPKASIAILALIKGLEDTDENVATSASMALSQMGPEAYGPVIGVFSHPKKEVRKLAAESLGTMKETVIPVLVAALNDRNETVREYSAMTLGLMGERAGSAVPALMKCAENEASSVRRSSAEALGKMGGRAIASIPSLTHLLRDKAKEVRESAAAGLHKMGRLATGAIPALTEALSDDNDVVRYWASKALQNFGPKAADAVPALTLALADETETVRANAAKALGTIGLRAKTAMPQLGKALDDTDKHVRSNAQWALEQLR
ncbi:MAG: HEAT repeat domain-containing protein [Deltaproteobacteria bacterium]|nr:HEAT repeat domain-containing protein [Deltaproteobacteria bacterium]